MATGYDANSLKSPAGYSTYDGEKEVGDFAGKRQYGYSDDMSKSPSNSFDHDTSKESHVIDGIVPYDRTMNTLAEATVSIRRSSALQTFFLIIADILGPTSIPYSISTLGWVPGALVGCALGFTAIYGGFLLWKLYLHYDSDARPIRTYGELVYRIFEKYGHGKAQGAKLFVAGLQVLELLLAVASTILGNASGLSQIVSGSPSGIVTCFLYYSMAITVLGMLISQIKMLHSVSRYAFVNFFLLIFLIGMILGIAATSGPLYGVTDSGPPGGVYGFGVVEAGSPVSTPIGVPYTFQIAVNGSLNLCYAFAGSLMFIEMMAEMKDALGFFKAALSAQLIIAVIYMAFGLALFGMQGQYIANPAQQGLSPYAWQTAGNAIYITTAVISCSIYANVGIRVVYICFLEEQWKIAPDMNTRKGTFIWGIVAFSFWGLAFLMCEAIPQFSSLTGISAALTVMPFTYTFPFLFSLMFLYEQDNGTWSDTIKKNMLRKTWEGFVFLASLGMIGLGLYSSITTMIQAVDAGNSFPFQC